MNITKEQKAQLLKYQTDPVVRQLCEIYNDRTFLEYFGISDKEDRHTDFLCTLLNEEQTQEIAAKGLLYAYLKYDCWVNRRKDELEQDRKSLGGQISNLDSLIRFLESQINNIDGQIGVLDGRLTELKGVQKVKNYRKVIEEERQKTIQEKNRISTEKKELEDKKQKLEKEKKELEQGNKSPLLRLNGLVLKFPEDVEDALLLGGFSILSVSANTRVKLPSTNNQQKKNAGGVVDLIVKVDYEIGDGIVDTNNSSDREIEAEEASDNGKNSTTEVEDAERAPSSNQLSPQNKSITIVLENKVWTNEHKTGRSGNDQTQEYYDSVTKQNAAAVQQNKQEPYPNPIFEYLTPTGMDDCKCSHYAHITYQDLLELVFTPIVESARVTESVKLKVRQYIEALDFRDRTIAVREKTENLLVEYWDRFGDVVASTGKNQNGKEERLLDDPDEMIMSAAKAVVNLGLVKAKEKAEAFMKAAQNYYRDYTQYKIVDRKQPCTVLSSDLSKRGMVLEAIKLLLNSVSKKDIEDAWGKACVKNSGTILQGLGGNQATFGKGKIKRPQSDKLFTNTSDATRYVMIGGCKVSNQWGNDIDYLVYMVNVIGADQNPKWPIRIEKM